MRDLIIKTIKDLQYLDWAFKRGDMRATYYGTYESWLRSLSDEELLQAYRRIIIAEEEN